MAAVKNFSGAIAVRFFLGVFEAAVTPGFALFSSQWYTKKEQGTRIGIWFSFNGFGQIFGGLVAYGIAKGAARHGSSIAPWKIVFLVTGLLTAAIGCLFLFFVPDNQLNARWLSKDDRRLAVERVRINQQGIGNKHFKVYQLKEALLDPITWAFVFFALTGDIPNGGISNFFSQLIVSFGYTAEQSLLYGTPGGAVVRTFRSYRSSQKPPYANSEICAGSRLPNALRLPRRPPPQQDPSRHLWPPHFNPRHDPHSRLTPIQRRRPPRRLLPHPIEPHRLRRPPLARLQQRSRLHQEDDRRRPLPNRLLRRQHHRAPDLPARRRPALRPRRDHNHLLLGRVRCGSAVHMVVLPPPEPEEGGL